MSIVLSSVAAFSLAVSEARTVDLSSYTLRSGAVRDALAGAAARGARVRVRLERDPLDDGGGTLHRTNAASITVLAAAGADAAASSAGSPVLHMKAAVLDGVAWLDDRNWAGDGRETIVRDDDPVDVAAVAAALDGRVGDAPGLGTTKAAAQGFERDVIAGAGSEPLSVESESFGAGAVYNALLARAHAGLTTRLLVAGREAEQPGPRGEGERRRLAHLASLGVDVRTGTARGLDFDEKLAVASRAAWVGSANATYARGVAGEQRDWGLATREPALVDGLRSAFEANWRAASPFEAARSERSEGSVGLPTVLHVGCHRPR